MLFLGSFRHDPNRVAMEWFAGQVLPLILQRAPQARLVVAGSDPPPAHAWPDFSGALELLGFVEDVREPLARYAVFVCPILSGSGVRVKLLEAFAAGIPVVSTRVGAEGLAGKDGEFCALADDPAGFADRVVALFENPRAAGEMAARARAEVEANWDMAAITRKLVDGYREMVREKRSTTSASSGQILLESAYNIGGAAVEIARGVAAGRVVRRPQDQRATWLQRGKCCPWNGRRTSLPPDSRPC